VSSLSARPLVALDLSGQGAGRRPAVIL